MLVYQVAAQTSNHGVLSSQGGRRLRAVECGCGCGAITPSTAGEALNPTTATPLRRLGHHVPRLRNW